MTVERYQVFRDRYMEQDSGGEWVAFEDFAAVERERDSARRALRDADSALVQFGISRPTVVQGIVRACRERDELRRRIADLDCRFTLGGVAEAGGSHCPLDKPCARCVTEREVERLTVLHKEAICEGATIGHMSATADAQERERRLREQAKEERCEYLTGD